METENDTETVNRREKLSMDISRDLKLINEDYKRVFDAVDLNCKNRNTSNVPVVHDHTSHSIKNNLLSSSNSIPKLSNSTCSSECLRNSELMASSNKMSDDVYKSQISHDHSTAVNPILESLLTCILHNEEHTKQDNDESSGSDVQESAKADVSPNEDSSEIPTTDVISDDSSSLDSRRTRRKSKRKLDGDFCCPVCGLTVREPELESHFAQEVERLTKIAGNLRKPRQRSADGISTTYVQVKSNRENRLTAKVAKYTAKANKEIQCPVCKLRMSGSEEDVNKHVALCFQNEEDSDEHIVVDDDEEDNDERFEEYEFADQTRIRPISLVPGGYRSLEGHVSKRHRPADENEDLEVDIDDTNTYGEPQYTELDIIPNDSSGDAEELRNAVLGNQSGQPQVLESRKWGNIVEANREASRRNHADSLLRSIVPLFNDMPSFSCMLPRFPRRDMLEAIDGVYFDRVSNETLINTYETDMNSWAENEIDENKTKENKTIEVSDQAVISLKERIKDLEDENKNVKCLICMDAYTKPVVSTTCWHVHCEECWLMTMGVKKLCPQCNMIVFPSDLRKIYL